MKPAHSHHRFEFPDTSMSGVMKSGAHYSPKARTSGEHTRLACWHWRPANANFRQIAQVLNRTLYLLRNFAKVRFGGTPKPALGTSALPGIGGFAAVFAHHFSSHPSTPAFSIGN